VSVSLVAWEPPFISTIFCIATKAKKQVMRMNGFHQWAAAEWVVAGDKTHFLSH
jgi:hypothetical protein